MNEELLSKKELLEQTGISYGQLYRWKRKDLIPEEWFIRKSTFTGQETFFPKEKIIERIDKIQKMKENLSLDELASMFSPNIKEVNLSKEEVVKRGIVTLTTMNLYIEAVGVAADQFTFENILTLYLAETLLQSGDINLDEAKVVIQVTADYLKSSKLHTGELVLIRKLGVSTCFIAPSVNEVIFEKGIKIVCRIAFSGLIEELRTILE